MPDPIPNHTPAPEPDPARGLIIRPARSGDAAALSALHGATFPGAWSPDFWQGQLGEPSSIVLVARYPGREPAGFVAARRAADEAEILSIAVASVYRRQGIAQALLGRLEADLRRQLPCRLFLEVSVENAAALGLYHRRGFIEVGDRKGYYDEPGRAAIDAKILALDLAD